MRWGSKRFDQDVDVDVVSVDPAAQLQAQLDPQGKSLEVKKSAAERKFLLKLDIFLLTYGCLSYVSASKCANGLGPGHQVHRPDEHQHGLCQWHERSPELPRQRAQLLRHLVQCGM